jgi:hypothetical protein
MHIAHTENGTGYSVTLRPHSTMFLFDESELPIVERIIQGFIEMYEDEEYDSFYYQLCAIYRKVKVSHTKGETQ